MKKYRNYDTLFIMGKTDESEADRMHDELTSTWDALDFGGYSVWRQEGIECEIEAGEVDPVMPYHYYEPVMLRRQAD